MASPAFIHDGIAFGCDYNPEQWDRAVWVEDVALMREAGVDIVAINIFGWSTINPRKGVYDFDGLDTIIALLHENGIRVNLGTGTSSAPPWLSTRHPELLPVADDGTRRYPGGRQAWCPSSPVFRAYAYELVEKVAERYGSHPALELWHVSNELGCHNAYCYCDVTAAAFRGWLERKYGTIAALNVAWGTSFWSQRYGEWDEILPPLRTLSSGNPGQALDFFRFSSDELLDYYRHERDIIRRHSTVPVTTNFMVMAGFRAADYWQWAPEMDVVSNDHYIDHRGPDPQVEASFSADFTRGLAGGDPWFLMEMSPSAVNWQPVNLAKDPGQLARTALTHLARGADAICFFQWRASIQGSEKFHSALVPHAGTDSALWREVVDLGGAVERLGEVRGTRVVSEVAMVLDWDSRWASELPNTPTDAISYLDQAHALYAALRALGVTVDVVRPGATLDGYRLVLVPGLYIVTDAAAAVIDDYVRGGGTALITFFSGISDEDDRVRLGGYPGAFRDLLGIRVEEFVPLLPGTSVTLTSGATATLWTERMTITDAEVVEGFVDGPARGMPALTRREAGAGIAWYAGTLLDRAGWIALLGRILGEAGVARHPAGGPEVEVVRRVGDDRSYLFVINHSAADVVLASSGEELIVGGAVSGALTVPAGTVRVVREARP